jgi:hypothetical protein
MNIEEIARQLNERAKTHPIGDLQKIRQKIHNLKKLPNKYLFSKKTTSNERAFHVGARNKKEIQFNIGIEKNNLLRYGIAFCLKTSKTVKKRDLPLFEPKIQRYNEFIKENIEQFSDLSLWYCTAEKKRINVANTLIINNALFIPEYFIFLGKESPQYTIEEILIIFDRLLPLYKYVEGEHLTLETKKFNFVPGNNSKVKSTQKNSKPKIFEIELRHNLLQDKLYEILSKQHGQNNVGTENNTVTGTKIDLVLKKQGGFWFYEIKTASTLKLCLREAISQLLEYSYWPCEETAEKLIVVTEHNITENAKKYLFKLRNELRIPIYYQNFDLETNKLSELN